MSKKATQSNGQPFFNSQTNFSQYSVGKIPKAIAQIPINEISQALPTETEEESDDLNMEEVLKENAGQATEVISDKNEEKLSARLVEKLMEDYAFQGSKSISELQKERIEKQKTKEDSPQRFLAYV